MNETFRDLRNSSALKRQPINFQGGLVKTKNTFTIRIDNGQAPLETKDAGELAMALRH